MDRGIRVPRLVIEPSERKVDPLLGTSHSIRLNFEQLDQLDLPKPEPGWLEKWTTAEQVVEEKIDQEFQKTSCEHEPKVARILSEHLPIKSHFFCANSMPIRDLEWFWKPSKKKRRLFGARGVNGIDGTLELRLALLIKVIIPLTY